MALLAAAIRVSAGQTSDSAAAVRREASRARALRVVVSIAARRLWVIRGSADTMRAAPVAVGSEATLRFDGREWRFGTPAAVRSVRRKEIDPAWVRPDWSYVEVAKDHGFRVESLRAGRPRPLADGGALVVRGGRVGTLRDSDFEPWPVDDEIIVQGVLFVPPVGTQNRVMQGILGRYRLDLGDGLGIHGTTDASSVGTAGTHGCLRLGDADLAWLFRHVPVGTKVYIF